MPSLPKFKNWCFTLNNYTQLEVDALKACGNLVKYMVVGHEVGESGTPHLQGFVTMKNAVRFNSMKQLLGDRAHIEPAREKVEKNFRYCTKDGDFWEVNDIRQLGGDVWLRSTAQTIPERYAGFRNWRFWQYSGTGLLDGVENRIDLNCFNGTRQDFAKWLDRRLIA